jgi:serine/threonine transporter
MGKPNPVLHFIKHGSLVTQIVIGLIAGILLATLFPELAMNIGLLGTLFIGALKSIAPLLVFVLVMASIANHRRGQQTRMGAILLLYLLGTFLAALVAVIASFAFPQTIALTQTSEMLSAPGGIGEVLGTLLKNIIDNPVAALMNANYMGILAWAIALGRPCAMRTAPPRACLATYRTHSRQWSEASYAAPRWASSAWSPPVWRPQGSRRWRAMPDCSPC